MSKFFRLVALRYPENAKHPYSVRIGSGTAQANGSVACVMDAIPVDWDGCFSLVPVVTQTKDDEGRS